jgi:hypothetical protein
MYYAIRHTRTGYFLPSQGSWGFTRTEPLPASRAPPRLFIGKGRAQQALDWWLKGECYEHRSEEDDMNGTQEIVLKTIPKPGRRREEMEIVVIDIRVLTLAQAAIERL